MTSTPEQGWSAGLAVDEVADEVFDYGGGYDLDAEDGWVGDVDDGEGAEGRSHERDDEAAEGGELEPEAGGLAETVAGATTGIRRIMAK